MRNLRKLQRYFHLIDGPIARALIESARKCTFNTRRRRRTGKRERGERGEQERREASFAAGVPARSLSRSHGNKAEGLSRHDLYRHGTRPHYRPFPDATTPTATATSTGGKGEDGEPFSCGRIKEGLKDGRKEGRMGGPEGPPDFFEQKRGERESKHHAHPRAPIMPIVCSGG